MEFIGDTEELFRLLSKDKPRGKYDLGTLYEELGGLPSEAHRALADVRMIEYVLSRLWREEDVVTSIAALTKTSVELKPDLSLVAI
jgi:hypothetical protein